METTNPTTFGSGLMIQHREHRSTPHCTARAGATPSAIAAALLVGCERPFVQSLLLLLPCPVTFKISLACLAGVINDVRL